MLAELDLGTEIDRQAADWLARRRLAGLSPVEEAEFAAWCAADPRNAIAYEDMAITLEDISALGSLAELEPLDEAPPKPGRFPRRWAAGTAAAAAGLAAILVLPTLPREGEIQASTLVAEVRPIVLEDGTRVTLGGKSEIKVRFDDGQRRVDLVSGEAFFEIAEDKARPFVVTAAGAMIHDIGTKFDVRRTGDSIEVGVLEGAVEVRPTGLLGGDTVRRLDAGERVRGRAVGLGPIVATADLSDKERAAAPPGAWREGQLAYDDATLSAVVTDLNRYYRPGVRLEADGVGDTRLAAAFKVHEIDKFLSELPSVAPVVVWREPGGGVVITPRSDPPAGG